eukprot:Skav204329  [mRNA]  locus=scaffold1960:39428:48585:- [translate_table: standard]
MHVMHTSVILNHRSDSASPRRKAAAEAFRRSDPLARPATPQGGATKGPAGGAATGAAAGGATVQRAKPGILGNIDPQFFKDCGVSRMGHQLLLAKGIVALRGGHLNLFLD